MLKQGITWFTLASNNPQETVYNMTDILPEMACDLEPTCNFLFGFFMCTLPEDMNDVDITVHTLKEIHTFKKNRNTQISRYNPCSMVVKPFPSLWKKMKDYIKERQAISNPFTNRSYPSRSKPSPLPKDPKLHPQKEEIQ